MCRLRIVDQIGIFTYIRVIILLGYRYFFFFFSSRRRHTRCREVSWARRCVQETGINAEYMGIQMEENFCPTHNQSHSLFCWECQLSRCQDCADSQCSHKKVPLKEAALYYSQQLEIQEQKAEQMFSDLIHMEHQISVETNQLKELDQGRNEIFFNCLKVLQDRINFIIAQKEKLPSEAAQCQNEILKVKEKLVKQALHLQQNVITSNTLMDQSNFIGVLQLKGCDLTEDISYLQDNYSRYLINQNQLINSLHAIGEALGASPSEYTEKGIPGVPSESASGAPITFKKSGSMNKDSVKAFETIVENITATSKEIMEAAGDTLKKSIAAINTQQIEQIKMEQKN
eukprot:TRINITY_DN18107_c0_g2_i1.p1 TRINITY_DN18107_c0_g2~~TRINITY_DN18107_c0_g2_i1.p1  ORF type:complete len:343 (-),score=86.80 TRINITY_DN18107_c0_g2_i1:520-1548(-)